jgi:hypothetical protein
LLWLALRSGGASGQNKQCNEKQVPLPSAAEQIVEDDERDGRREEQA